MKQTALDYLLSELQNVIELYKTEWEELDSIVKNAKEMEKEQMCDTWVDSRTFDKGDNYFGKQKSFDEYYNEIFNSKEE